MPRGTAAERFEVKRAEMLRAEMVANMRVVGVEDDKGVNELAQKTLQRAGFDVFGVLTGAEAIACVTADPDLLMLVDQKLTDMDGTELIRTLAGRGIRVPFVAMTGCGDERTAVEMMKLNARDYLVKGADLFVRLAEVFQRVRRELGTEERLARATRQLKEKHLPASFKSRIAWPR